jgi:hypothetical protein
VAQRKEGLIEEGENTRTTLITGTGGVGVGVERFLGNSWTAKLELTATPQRPRVSLKLNYFPIEGRVVGFGIDSRSGVTAHRGVYFDDDDIAGARLMFYLCARAFVASTVEFIAEQFPPVAALVAGGGSR